MAGKIKGIKIDEDKCVGCGACGMIAPDAFGFDENKGKAVVNKGAKDTNHEKIREAVDSCPVQAITIRG